MDQQQLVNISFVLVTALISVIFKIAWSAIKTLQKSGKALLAKINHVKLDVAENYVKKDDHLHISDKLFDKLDGISKQLGSQ